MFESKDSKTVGSSIRERHLPFALAHSTHADILVAESREGWERGQGSAGRQTGLHMHNVVSAIQVPAPAWQQQQQQQRQHSRCGPAVWLLLLQVDQDELHLQELVGHAAIKE